MVPGRDMSWLAFPGIAASVPVPVTGTESGIGMDNMHAPAES